MALIFDACEGCARNVCCELASPLFGKDLIRVTKDDMRWFVPRGQVVPGSLLSDGVPCLWLGEWQHPRPPQCTRYGIGTVVWSRTAGGKRKNFVKSIDCDRLFQSRSD